MSPRRDLADLPDYEVVVLARQGSEAAYGELVRRYRRPVLKLIDQLVHDRELAEDLTQETFVKAFNRLGSQRLERGFMAWIFRIANNAAVDHLRSRPFDPLARDNSLHAITPGKIAGTLIQPADRSDSTPRRVRARKARPALEQAIGRLRREYRRCIRLRYLEERSYDNIADILDLPVGTVSTYLHRGRADLKAMLGPLLESSSSDSACTPA